MDRTVTLSPGNELRRIRRGGVVCPSLALAHTVVCDRFGPLLEPGSAYVREYCTTEEYLRCHRWLKLGGPQAVDAQDLIFPQGNTVR